MIAAMREAYPSSEGGGGSMTDSLPASISRAVKSSKASTAPAAGVSADSAGPAGAANAAGRVGGDTLNHHDEPTVLAAVDVTAGEATATKAAIPVVNAEEAAAVDARTATAAPAGESVREEPASASAPAAAGAGLHDDAVGGDGDWHSSSAQQSLRALTLLGRGGTVYFNEVNILDNATKTRPRARSASSSSREGEEPLLPISTSGVGVTGTPLPNTAAMFVARAVEALSEPGLGDDTAAAVADTEPVRRPSGIEAAILSSSSSSSLRESASSVLLSTVTTSTELARGGPSPDHHVHHMQAAEAAAASASSAQAAAASTPSSRRRAKPSPFGPVGLAQLFPDMFTDPAILCRMMAQVVPPKLRPEKHKLRVHPDSSRVVSQRDSVRRLAKARPARTLPPGTLGATVVDAKKLTNNNTGSIGAAGGGAASGRGDTVPEQAGQRASGFVAGGLEGANEGEFGGRTVLLLRLKLHQNFHWSCGDAFGVYCENDSAEVEALLTRLRVQRSLWDSESLDFTPKLPHVFPNTSLRTLLTFCCALRWIFQKSFLRALAEYCADEFEKNQLLLLSSATGRVYFDALILRQQPSVLELLELFPSCVPPVSMILSNSAPLSPRYYSVANSPLALDDSPSTPPDVVAAAGAGAGTPVPTSSSRAPPASLGSSAGSPVATRGDDAAAAGGESPSSASALPLTSKSLVFSAAASTEPSAVSLTAASATSSSLAATSEGAASAAASEEARTSSASVSADKSAKANTAGGDGDGDSVGAHSHSRIIEVVFSVVRYTIGSHKHPVRRSGLCTTWLEAIAQPFFRQDRSFQSREITLVHRPAGDFRPPDDVERPMIMVGPGTGVSPFVGFLKHREAQKAISERIRHDEVGPVLRVAACLPT
jgi:hypothetical protein